MGRTKKRRKLRILYVFPAFPDIVHPYIIKPIIKLIEKGHFVQIYSLGKMPFEAYYKDLTLLKNRVHFFEDIPKNIFLAIAKTIYYFTTAILKAPLVTLKAVFICRYSSLYPFSFTALYRIYPFVNKNLRFDVVYGVYDYLATGIGALLKASGIAKVFIPSFGGPLDIDLNTKQFLNIRRQAILTFEEADAIIEVSNYSSDKMKEYIIKLGRTNLNVDRAVTKVKTIYQPVDFDLLNELKQTVMQQNTSLTREEKKKDGVIKILTVGRLTEQKGIEYGIQAVALLVKKGYCNIEYDIVGGGELQKYLQSLALKLNIQNYVKFLGVLSHREVYKEMLNADIFLLPSRWEPFGVVLIEAQACGLPVVASDVDGVPEATLRDKTSFLVPVGDINAIAEKLELLITNEKLRYEMGKKGREFTQQNFSMEKVVSNLEQLYYNLIYTSPTSISLPQNLDFNSL